MLATSRVYDLVKLALRECGIVSLGDTINAAITQEALLILNSIRAEWSLNVRNYVHFDEVYTATENKTHITLGDGGDIPKRPHHITQVVVISGLPGTSVNYSIPVGTYEEYRRLAIQNIFAIPSKCYVDTSFPLQNVWFYPGLATGWSVRVEGMSYMTEYENITDPYIDPPEYFSALYLHLALRIAPKYGVDLAEGSVIAAKSALKQIEMNMFMTRLQPMPGLLQHQGSAINFFAGVP